MTLETPPKDEAWAWNLVLALAERARQGAAFQHGTGIRWDTVTGLEEVSREHADLLLEPALEPCFGAPSPLTPSVRQLFELYLPLCVGPAAQALVLGHVGQSLDGQIATRCGDSRYVTGPENIVHMHRLRSLVDAVVVGASTVFCDDPELTTRLVPGRHPTRVVIDPGLRLPHDRKLYRDGLAPTLVVCEAGRGLERAPPGIAQLCLEPRDGRLWLPDLLAALAARGLRRIFVEGGGITISHFLEKRCLTRLHVTVCPIIIGQGRPGISICGVDRLEHALRPVARRFNLGEDVLFDCRLLEP